MVEDLYVCKENMISSTNHTVRTVHTRKVGLTAFDTKRWLCEDKVHTHSYGHKDTVSNPPDLFTKSCLVKCFTIVGIFSHNDQPGTTPLAEWVLSDLSHESVFDPQSPKINSHKTVFDIIFANLSVALQCSV